MSTFNKGCNYITEVALKDRFGLNKDKAKLEGAPPSPLSFALEGVAA
ncbi:hypothetical protein Nhal_1717 [Nitrosococcus halophilus Nc 4]|uniref:Uncharacterized protein n=1 Tax=Nitrosococcus halophilus (strain Nc4) TaxID=472759 RepID=D5C2I2_NITHN|nr:hypothetical protein Nhal_1717 [Nitrosococcus halophilus Nc 4]